MKNLIITFLFLTIFLTNACKKEILAQEKELLDVWTKAKAGNPLYYYGRQGTSIDPRLQNEDLGDNAMLASNYGIANLKRILPNIEKWTFQKGEEFVRRHCRVI